MALPSDEDFGELMSERMKELNRTLSEAQREEDARAERSGVGRRATDNDITAWRRWLAEHLPAFFGVMTAMTLALGWLGGRVLNSEAREHDQFRAAIVALQQWQQELNVERSAERYRVAQFTAMAQKNSDRLDELLPHLYMSLRADAEDRGDKREVAKLDKKLKAAIADSKAAGGNP